jgi:metallo-beta-lactamase class B
MFARRLLVCGTLAATMACSPPVPSQEPRQLAVHPPPAARPDMTVACKGRDGWSDPAPPVHVFGNVYDVGTCGIVVLLVTSPEGHVLIDGATEKAAPLVLANIRTLGFDPRDVRWMLASHEHDDHVGGLAALKAATGARLAVLAQARASYETGKSDPSDPQLGLSTFPAVAVDRDLRDGEVVTLGPLKLTAHATYGHTPGSTSWSWRSCEGDLCHAMAYVDSLTAISNTTYRFTEHPEYVEKFRSTLDRVAALDCDILMTPHPAASALFERLAGTRPLVDGTGCHTYADRARTALDARLAKEKTQ